MAEYIDRQSVKDAIKKEWDGCGGQYEAWAIIKDTCDAIDELPSADVRPVVRGRWVVHRTAMGTNYSVCSECEKEFCFRTDYGTLIKIDLSGTNYCPNCGADNRGEGDGN